MPSLVNVYKARCTKWYAVSVKKFGRGPSVNSKDKSIALFGLDITVENALLPQSIKNGRKLNGTTINSVLPEKLICSVLEII